MPIVSIETVTHCHRSAPLRFTRFDEAQASAIFICAALFIYAERDGSYLVRAAFWKRPAEFPSPAVLTNEGYTHGRMIGQVERAIVVLIVMGGNPGALAFFFAAKD
ncbi:MAG TPA: hypothetical protein VGF88_15755 [Acidobacteriaceae bacterium]|jgi:hypothetical protein